MIPNPHLPPIKALLSAVHTRQHRRECREKYYLATLELAQSHWLSQKPAQAILQLNKAFFADLTDDSPILKKYPLPYLALLWFLKNRRGSHFLGNPVRHFQHLATRLTGPRRELRAQRAWACFYLAKNQLPEKNFPLDEAQIERDQLIFPAIPEVLAYFQKSRPQEAEHLQRLLRMSL